jgi:rare lipoprotein A (peptidoglycan hydrolase)
VRYLTLIAAMTAAYVIHVQPLEAAAQARQAVWSYGVASAYSTQTSGSRLGCGGRLDDHALSVATLLVPCGARVQLCYAARCVTVTRRDSGPYVAGRSFDLTTGVVRAFGFSSPLAWGVRTLRWRRL